MKGCCCLLLALVCHSATAWAQDAAERELQDERAECRFTLLERADAREAVINAAARYAGCIGAPTVLGCESSFHAPERARQRYVDEIANTEAACDLTGIPVETIPPP